MDHSQSDSSVLELVAMSSSRGSSRPRNWIHISCIAGRFFICWAIKEVQYLFIVKQLISIQKTLGKNVKCIHHTAILQLLFSSVQFSSFQSLSPVRLFATPWTTAHQASLSITNSQSPPQPMSIVSVMPSSHLILCRPLLLLPPIPPRIRVFSNESTLCKRWPKYWSFSFNISLSNEHPGLISFRMDWLDLLAVQGTLKSSSTPQFKSINSLALSFLYSPTLTSIHDYWKNHSFDLKALCWQSNVSALYLFIYFFKCCLGWA